MLKITELSRSECKVILKLEGRVAENWMTEIKKACEQARAGDCHLILDMADVSFVERRAVSFFQELRAQKVDLVNCSPFLSEQLKKGDFYADSFTRY